MKVQFKNIRLQELYEFGETSGAKYHKLAKEVVKQYRKKVDMLIGVESLSELKDFKSLNFEKLKGSQYE